MHAFTPRQPVRSLTLEQAEANSCPYVVHLEDNETAIQAAVPTRFDACAVRAFLDAAAGVTVVIERLLELKPEHVPGAVVWPGYDELIERPGRARESIRRDIGLEDGDIAIVYSGNVHEVNVDEVRSLYEAVRSLRVRRPRLVLVKSGWNRVPNSLLPSLGEGVRDLGWISRRRVFELLRAADILVQPGSPGAFNDYRFPSKLPEFLASGRPVVLPRTNIGLQLENGVEAMLLEHGGKEEIAEKVGMLADDSELRRSLGDRGRAFAVRELRWSTNVRRVARLYEAASGI